MTDIINVHELSANEIKVKDLILSSRLLDSQTTISALHEIGKVIYSPEKDVVISVNSELGRGIIAVDPGKVWNVSNSGIVFSSKPAVTEPDGIKTIIYSQSERCYYVGTTEGLYKTYDQSLTNCVRVLKDQICADVSNADKAIMYAHVLIVKEIDHGIYFIFVSHVTVAISSYIIYDGIHNKVLKIIKNGGQYYTDSQWAMNAFVQQDPARNVVRILLTKASGAQPILRIIEINKTDYSDSSNYKTCYINAAVNGKASSQEIELFNGKYFMTRHYSDNAAEVEKDNRGEIIYVNADAISGIELTNDITVGEQQVDGSSMFSVIAEDNSICERVFQLRQTANRLFFCTGLSAIAEDDKLGLFEITVSDGNVNYVSLSSNAYLAGYKGLKDLFYSNKLDKWFFVFDRIPGVSDAKIYMSNAAEDGTWTELTATNYNVGISKYSKFKEFENIIAIEAQLAEDQPVTMIETNTNSARELATLDDVSIQRVFVDGNDVGRNVFGQIDINISHLSAMLTAFIAEKYGLSPINV